ncbi:MAG: DUF4457 domain-containing protein [Deltaproteobacteria bacterium]|nr:DUF4457 domain-containing protein [Deltaproteobacteria bacterium]
MSFSNTIAKWTDTEEYKPSVNGTKITAPSIVTFGTSLIMAFAEVVSVPAENKVVNTLAKSSPGTLAEREVDMGMDFASGDNGGMVLTKGGSNHWLLFDTVRGPLKALYTNIESTEISDDEFVKDFTKNGIKVGTHELVNGTSDQFYMGFQTDEKIRPPKWKAKSVVFDIADNYGATDYIRLRSIEFYKDGVLLPFTESDISCSSTTSNSTFEAKNIFITGKSKIGSDANNGWKSEAGSSENQRIVVNFNTEIEFDKVVINNGHESGTNTNSGAKAIDIQITDFDYVNITYDAVVTGSVNRIFKSNIFQHPVLDQADDKIYVDISDEWQVNRASGFGMCKIKGTGANRVLRTPYGKEVCMLWEKSITNISNWRVYFHALGVSNDLRLNLTNSEMAAMVYDAYLNSPKPFEKDEFYFSGTDDSIIYAWFGDYFQDSGTGEVVSEDNKRVMGVKGTTAFFKGTKTTPGTDIYETNIDDIETIMWKSKSDASGHWHLINRSLNNFQDLYYLDTNDPKTNASITIDGSKITIINPSASLDSMIFMVFGRSADKDTKDYIPWMNQVNHVGTGLTDTHIDLGLDFSSGDNGGMVLQKSCDHVSSFIISDTLRGIGKQLCTEATSAETITSEHIKEYTETGIKVGNDTHINMLNHEIATFGFQTTHRTEPTTRKNVRTVIFKFADNWGDSSWMGVRRIEFYNNDSLISLAEDDFTAYSTSEHISHQGKHAFITSNIKIDEGDNKSWQTTQITNQVLIIVLKDVKDISHIRVNNFHSTGSETDRGVKNTKVYFTAEDLTEDQYSNFSYTDEVPNSELVYDGIFDQHHASNAECYTQYLYTPWHYNPQTGFGFFTHKGNGTEITIENVLGKEPTMIWTKNLKTTHDWVTYSKIAGEGKYGVLNTGDSASRSELELFKDVNNNDIKFGVQQNVNNLNANHITYVWVGDDMSTLGNPQEAYGIIGTSLFTEKKAADTEIELGFEPEIVITKIISNGSWAIKSLNYDKNENVFDSYLLLSSSVGIANTTETGKFWSEGTKLKFGSAWTGWGDCLVCAFAKDTYKPQGKSIVIHGSESKPSLFSIANGFNRYQAVDKLIGYDRNVVFSFNEGDGTYYIKLNMDGTITLKNENCFYGDTNPNSSQDFFDVEEYKMFSPSGSVVPGVYIGKIVIQNDAILDVQKFQTGVKAKVDWFPVGQNSMYIKDNPFFTNEIDWDIWWNSTDSDDNMRYVNGQVVYSSKYLGFGAHKRQNSNEIIVGTGGHHTFNSFSSGDDTSSSGGYYKLIIRRNF